MGICSSNKKVEKPLPTNQTHPDMPKSKYSLALPLDMALHDIDIPIMIVGEGLAYNFLVKQGVLRQKGQDPEGDTIYLCEDEEKDQAALYWQIGLLSVKQGISEILNDAKHARVLFNFKAIWVFRGQVFDKQWLTTFLKALQTQQVKPKQVNFCSQPLGQLIQKYKLITPSHSILKNFYPLQLFQSSDINDTDKTNNNAQDEQFSIYIHGLTHLNQTVQNQINLYSQCLSIRNVIFLFENVEMKTQKALEKELYKVSVFPILNADGQLNQQLIMKRLIPYIAQLRISSSNLLIVHDQQSSQHVNYAISEYLLRQELIHQKDVEKYLEQRKAIVVHGNTRVISQMKNQKKQEETPQFVQEKTRCEEIKELYQSLTVDSKSPMPTQSLHQTILRLIENIIQSPNEDKFRTIQTSNKKIQLTVLQYKQGIQLLNICGFAPQPQEQPTQYVNAFDPTMLKLIRGDIELAYKNAL